MTIDNTLLSTLSSLAKTSPRLRQNYDLRNSEDDNSQRMLNALEPGMVMPIHRHRKTSETICMVRGKMVMRLYDDKGNVTDEFVMEPCGSILWSRLRLDSGIRWRCWMAESGSPT